MTSDHPSPPTRRAPLRITAVAGAAAALFLLGAASALVSVQFGGFARGLLIGAAIGLIAVGGFVLGTHAGRPGDPDRSASWLPSRDGDG